MLTTASKLRIARLAGGLVRRGLALTGSAPEVTVRRGGIAWQLDLREGIELAIYLAGVFERATWAAYRGLLRPGDRVLDAGANIGAHTLPLARCVGPAGRVLAVEPTDYAHARLTRNIALNPELAARIVAEQAMLAADADGEVAAGFYSSWPADGRDVDCHARHLGVMMSADGARRVTVDSLVAARGFDSLQLVKLDVDGYELEVLEGARATLSRDRPAVIMELAPYTVRERGQEPLDIITLLRDHGYGFSTLNGRPLAIDRAYLERIPAGAGINVIASHGSGRPA
ncbi:MAG: FkbM family methyltransferase [Gammaproteobacteria bacterium]